MQSKSPVEIADMISRRRAWCVAAAAAAFLIIQLIARPFFGNEVTSSHTTTVTWGINAGALLLFLIVGGGWGYGREVRLLVNDEVSRANHYRAVWIGYWIAMVIAMTVYAMASRFMLTSRETVYIIVTPSVGFALLAFSYFEVRAHRDA